MKKLLCALCLVLVLGSLAGCADKNSGKAKGAKLADDDAIFTVSYNYIRPSIHDDDIPGYCEEHGFKQITKNDDGTYTFRQDRAAYEEQMADRKASLMEYLEDILTNEEFGAYVLSYDLDADNAFRHVTITVDSEKYLAAEDHTDIIGEYILSVYQYFMEDSEDDPAVTVDIVSESTGKTLNSVDFPQTGSSNDFLY